MHFAPLFLIGSRKLQSTSMRQMSLASWLHVRSALKGVMQNRLQIWATTFALVLVLSTFAEGFSITYADERDPDESLLEDAEIEDDPVEANDYVSLAKRYRNNYSKSWHYYGHRSRYPWKRLPNTMCFRHECSSDKQCCRRFNLCDGSAKRCIDCWFGKLCKSERQCCQRYPFCKREWRMSNNGRRYVHSGRCTAQLG